jgi:tetratricopeptide (TPR) repeat protein
MVSLWTKKERWSAAIKTYKKAIRYFPKDSAEEIAAAYQDLGCALWEDQRRYDALEAWITCLKHNPKNRHAKHNLKKFTNEFGLPSSSIGKAMDDVNAFLHFKMGEYLSSKGKSNFENVIEVNKIITKLRMHGIAILYQSMEERLII